MFDLAQNAGEEDFRNFLDNLFQDSSLLKPSDP